MKAIQVPEKEAEDVKKELIKEKRMDFTRVPSAEGGFVYFPIKDEFETDYNIIDKPLEGKETEPSFEEILEEKLTAKELQSVKTSQDIIGDIAIVEVSEELEEKGTLIGKALLQAKPYLKSVYKKGKHEGTYRTQQLKLLAGKEDKVTVHTENGVQLKLNVETVYFSPRLSTERKRVAELVQKGERVLVMFSGCGPYPLTIEKLAEPEEIIGVEINPEAHAYGLENVKINKAENVTLYEGDVAQVVPDLKGRFDRIVMPAPDNAAEYLTVALKKINPGGTIHYYDFMEAETYQRDAKEVVAAACAEAEKEFDIINIEKAGQVGIERFRVCTEFKVN